MFHPCHQIGDDFCPDLDRHLAGKSSAIQWHLWVLRHAAQLVWNGWEKHGKQHRRSTGSKVQHGSPPSFSLRFPKVTMNLGIFQFQARSNSQIVGRTRFQSLWASLWNRREVPWPTICTPTPSRPLSWFPSWSNPWPPSMHLGSRHQALWIDDVWWWNGPLHELAPYGGFLSHRATPWDFPL